MNQGHVLSKKVLAKAMIDRRGKTFNTAPERNFQAFVDFYHLPYKMNESRDFWAENRRGVRALYSFQMDFVEFADPSVFTTWKVTGHVPANATIKEDVEIDGDGHSEKNDPWKDGVKNRENIKVIHVPGSMTRRKMWPKLLDFIREARASSDMTVKPDEYSR